MAEYTVIDLGSFSALLLIARMDEMGLVQPLLERYKVTHLGEDVAQTGRLKPEAIEQTMNVLAEYQKLIAGYPDTSVFVIGSEALRRAKNSADLHDKIKRRFAWELDILAAQDEAQLSYLGAISGMTELSGRCCVVDLGGGSCEFSVGKGWAVESKKSVPIGAVGLYEKSGRKESLCSGERLELFHFVKILLEEHEIKELLSNVEEFIVCGGTITTLAAVKKKLTVYNPGAVNGMALSRKELWDIYFLLNAKTVEERKKIPGLEAGREKVVLFGALIILTLMEWLQIEYIRVSDRGLRYGYLQNKLLKTEKK